MMHVRYQCPGDPVDDALLLFGGEFLQMNPDRAIVITNADGGEPTRIPMGDDIVCDACNAGVDVTDPCVLTPRRLYCWTCGDEWVLKHLRRDAPPTPVAMPRRQPRA